MQDLKISTKLSIAFSVLLISLIGIIVFCSSKFNVLQSNLDQIVNENNQRIELANKMQTAVQNVSRIIRNITLLQEPIARDREYAQLERERANYDEASNLLEPHIVTAEGRELFSKIGEWREKSRGMNDIVKKLAYEGRQEESVNVLLKQANEPVTQWRNTITEFEQLQKSRSKLRYEEATRQVDIAKRDIDFAGFFVAIAGIALAISIIRSIKRPLNDAIEMVKKVADGDLTEDIPNQRQDEMGNLLVELAKMQSKLTAMILEMQTAADSVAQNSGEIELQNNSLAERTEGQASALEQTSAAMEQLNAAVRTNADGAAEANNIARRASDVAFKGGQVVSQVVDTMKEINDSSKKIADIVSLIDSIAFQTNILALNAAVEAARAGEQGRGFAVVATEVRNLAKRSAEAAREINSLISASVERVEYGADLVDEAGKTMNEVVSNIENVTHYVARIAQASEEQSIGVSQVKEAIESLDQVTQKNAILVERTSTLSRSLNDRAIGLVRSASAFRFKGMHLH